MIKEIKVSNEDIAGSKPLDPCDCAIAKALNRAFYINNSQVKYTIKKYSVDVYFLVNNQIYDKDRIIDYEVINSFITCFDMGHKCSPFKFGIIL